MSPAVGQWMAASVAAPVTTTSSMLLSFPRAALRWQHTKRDAKHEHVREPAHKPCRLFSGDNPAHRTTPRRTRGQAPFAGLLMKSKLPLPPLAAMVPALTKRQRENHEVPADRTRPPHYPPSKVLSTHSSIRYDHDFKERACEEVRVKNRMRVEVEAEFGLSISTFGEWLKQYDERHGNPRVQAKRFPVEHKLGACEDIRLNGLSFRKASTKWSATTTTIRGWLARYDSGELKRESNENEPALLERLKYQAARIADLEAAVEKLQKMNDAMAARLRARSSGALRR
jgi:transposase